MVAEVDWERVLAGKALGFLRGATDVARFLRDWALAALACGFRLAGRELVLADFLVLFAFFIPVIRLTRLDF